MLECALADIAPIKLTPPPGAALNNLSITALLIAGLYFGREIFVPLALAVLLSFVLTPFVARLQVWHVPKPLAVAAVVIVSFAIIFSLGGLMVTQAGRLAENLPSYQATLQKKIESVRGLTAGSSTLERASQVLKDLDAELKSPTPGETPRSSAGTLLRPAGDRPVPVEVRQPEPGAFATLAAIVQPLLHPLTTTGVVAIFTIFILFQRQDLRNRLVRLAGSNDIQRTTAALDDAGERLSRLFLTQLIFNSIFGIVIGAGLWLIGVPSAPLWGLIATIMRFVPYIGALISAVFPLILAAAVGPDWQMLILTALLFVIVEPVAGHVIEPLLFGHSSGLSPVAVIVAASFWTWLWGPLGLLLATPLTICLVVVGRHVERLKFLDVMFGDRPALTPPQLLYQRLLAGDPIEASEQAQAFLKDHTLEEYQDSILLGALHLAEDDRKRGRLDDARMERIVTTVRDLTSDFEDQVFEEPDKDDGTKLTGIEQLSAAEKPSVADLIIPPPFSAAGAIVCIPAGGALDEAAAQALAQSMKRRGLGAVAESADALSMGRIFALDLSKAEMVLLCYLDQPSPARLHYATRRIARKNPKTRIVVVLLDEATTATGETLAQGAIKGTLSAATAAVLDRVRQPPPATPEERTAI